MVKSIATNSENDDVRAHTLSFINYTNPELVIKKVATGTEEPLAGAVFEVIRVYF